MSEIRVSEEDRSTVYTLTSKHPELRSLEEDPLPALPGTRRSSD